MARISSDQDLSLAGSLPANLRRTFTFDMQRSENFICLPKNFDDLNKLLKCSDHQASQLVGSSLKAHRNPYEAMIFLYGISGHGKSSTLNHLFKTELIPTSDNRSCTEDVIEYVATMDSLHWNVTGLELGFVDTPGFGDTASDEKNIKNLAKIDDFISNHPFLRSPFSPERIYPNIVMIVISVNDNRMGDLNSQFAKMLRMLSKLKIIDKVRPNVVIVVTHTTSLRPASKFSEKKKRKFELVNNLARLYFGVSFPIVFIENEHEDLQIFGDWTLLPDGTKQPLNLFDTMISLMKQSGDEIGIETIRLLFENRRNIQIYTERELGSDKGIFKGIDSHPDFPKWKKIIMSEFKLSFDSEANRCIIACIKENRFPQLSSLSYEMVLPLMHRLQEVQLNTAIDLSSKNIEEVNQQLFPFCMNKQERILMFELFKVKPLECLDFHMIGCGVFPRENILKFPIISLRELKYCHEIGTHIPDNTYYTSRGRLLIHCRCNRKKETMFSRSKVIISFAIQYELFSIAFDLSNITCEQMEKTFVKAVNSLPNYVSDHPHKKFSESYSSFIDKYGTQCVLGVSYGGEISGSVEFSLDPEMDNDYFYRVSLDMKKLLWIYFDTLKNGDLAYSNYSQALDSHSMRLFEELLNSPIVWGGGEKEYHASKLIDLSSANWSKWKGTICSKFILLENIVHVCHISALLSKWNKHLEISFLRALEEQFRNEIPTNDMYFFVYDDDPDRNTVLDVQEVEEEVPLTTIDSRLKASECAKSRSTTCKIF